MALSKEDRYQVRLQQPIDNYVFMLALDGANHELLYDLVDAGELPSIKEHFFDSMITGTRNGLCGMPAITPYCHENYMTGTLSTHPGLRTWNRRREDFDDYFDTLRPTRIEKVTCVDDYTLFDFIGGYTVAINEFASAGAAQKFKVWYPAGGSMAGRLVRGLIPDDLERRMFHNWGRLRRQYDYQTRYCFEVDRRAMQKAFEVYKKGPTPSFMTVWCAALDELAHREGGKSEVVAEALKAIDHEVDKIMAEMYRQGKYKQMIRVLTSDHSNQDVHTNLDIDEVLATAGIDAKQGRFDRSYELKATVLGDAMASLFFHSKHVDKQPNRKELADALSHIETTDLVVYKDNNGDIHFVKDGARLQVESRTHEGVQQYRIIGGRNQQLNEDGYPGQDVHANYGVLDHDRIVFEHLRNWHSLTQNVELTHDQPRPLAIPSFERVLSGQEAPDMVMFSKDGYDYSAEPRRSLWNRIINPFVRHNLKASHGYPSRYNMQVPLPIAGDPQHIRGMTSDMGVVSRAANIDLVPTIIDLLVEDKSDVDKVHSLVDGISMRFRPK